MQNRVTDFRLVAIAPYDAVRIVLGLLLLTAAALKGHQLATEPVAETSWLTSRWFLIGVVEFELFFGLWLLAGLYPRRTWQAALLCFGGFACVNLYKALSGEASCGCFGKVPVNPWYTFLLDTAAVAAMLWCRPQRGLSEAVQGSCRLLLRPAEVVVVCLAVGVPSALAMGSYRAAAIGNAGEILGDSRFVVLQPETWVGERFPLLDHIDIGGQLRQGQWITVLYRRTCSHCRNVVPEYQRLAEALSGRSAVPRVALIDCGARVSQEEAHSDLRSFAQGYLDARKAWVVSTPVALLIEDGVVRVVFDNPRNVTLLRKIWIGQVPGKYRGGVPPRISASLRSDSTCSCSVAGSYCGTGPGLLGAIF